MGIKESDKPLDIVSNMSEATEGKVVDYMYANFVECAGSSLVGLGKYAWGYRGSERFNERLKDFTKSMRELAKVVNVKYSQGDYYSYNGKIYVKVGVRAIHMAYEMLLEELGIMPMLGNEKVFKSSFIDVITIYGKLVENRNIIAFENGILDVDHDRFCKFSPEYHCTYMHHYKYQKGAKCWKWQNFLREVLPDRPSREILQMFLGLGLIQRSNVYTEIASKQHSSVELCLMLVGTGANGKSVIYRTAMGVFGKERISGAEYSELTALGDEGMRARRLLRGALFNWVSDADVRDFGKRTGVFKKIVSGEPVTDRKLGKDVEENVNMPYLVFNINELPSSDDHSLGFVRRLQYVCFDVVIPKDRQNRKLADELVEEYPGIFNWVMRGAKELRRRNFEFPDSAGSRKHMALTMLQTNPVLAWLTVYNMRNYRMLPTEQPAIIHTKVLLSSLEQFCKDNGVDMPSNQLFGSEMRTHGFRKTRKSDGMWYDVFGCSVDDLKKPFIIEDEDFAKSTALREQQDAEGFLLDND